MRGMQSTSRVLMIQPVRFTGNVETAASNRFQQLDAMARDEAAQRCALSEFNGLVAALRAAGVDAQVVVDTPEPHTPDSIFPNNWVSFHSDGSVVLYPMLAVNRRHERRADVIEAVLARGLRSSRTIDLSVHEQAGRFLEGTGSVVLDRVHRVAYASLSPRTDVTVLREFAAALDYRCITFSAQFADAPVYHTNVLMCIGTRFAVVCAEVIAESERGAVLAALAETEREIILIDAAQMQSFAGNMLELRDARGRTLLALSAQAQAALTPQQVEQLRELAGPLVSAPIPTIETLGGGSVRCMLCEVFLPTA